MGELILLGLFGVVPALAIARVVAWYTSQEQVLKRIARKLPFTPIEEVVAGQYVKVTAPLELTGAPLESPITGRKCAGWTVELLEETEDEHIPLLRDGALGEFALRSKDGAMAMIRPPREQKKGVVFEMDHEHWTGRFYGGPATGRLADFLAKHGLSPDKQYHYIEGVLEPDENVTVVGVADREPDPRATATYRDMAPTRVVFQRPPIWIIDGRVKPG